MLNNLDKFIQYHQNQTIISYYFSFNLGYYLCSFLSTRLFILSDHIKF